MHRHVSQPSRQAVSPGAFPMAAPFVPEALRELSEDAMALMRLEPSARAKFVEGLQGLGKIVLSNIRTPKVRTIAASVRLQHAACCSSWMAVLNVVVVWVADSLSAL